MNTKFFIGHPAYNGANKAHPKAVGSQQAKVILLQRGVSWEDAKEAVKTAALNRWASVETKSRYLVEILRVDVVQEHKG